MPILPTTGTEPHQPQPLKHTHSTQQGAIYDWLVGQSVCIVIDNSIAIVIPTCHLTPEYFMSPVPSPGRGPVFSN